MFYFVLFGLCGNSLKNWLLNKIHKNDFVWFHKFWFYFTIYFCLFIFTVNYNVIYLDNIHELQMEKVKGSISAEYLEGWLWYLGNTAGFLGGARLAAIYLAKHPMSIPSKIATSLATGTISSLLGNMLSIINGQVRRKFYGNPLTDSSLTFGAENVNVSTNTTNLQSSSAPQALHAPHPANEINNSFPSLHNKSYLERREWILKKGFQKSHSLSTDQLENSGVIINDNNVKASLLDTIKENQLTRAFHDTNQISGEQVPTTNVIENVDGINSACGAEPSSSIANCFIDAPLEDTIINIFNETLKADLTTILSYNFLINMGTVYLLCILTFAITTRFVVDHDFILNKVKSLNSPFGKVLHYILTKLLSAWKTSSVLWIYFILFFVICFCCGSAYAMYGCLYLITMSKF